MSEFMNISDYLIQWGKLPGYSWERRIDPLIGYYLSQILGLNISREDIFPEFPIPCSSGKGVRSDHVDFVCWDSAKSMYLIELKTYHDSIHSEDGKAQFEHMLELAADSGRIFTHLARIWDSNTQYLNKHYELVRKLYAREHIPKGEGVDLFERVTWVGDDGKAIKAQRRKIHEYLETHKFASDRKCIIYYIAPCKPQFNDLNPKLQNVVRDQCNFISLSKAADMLGGANDGVRENLQRILREIQEYHVR